MLIAVVVYDGVLDDECVAFRSVLGLVDGARVVMVGARQGEYAGVGGSQQVDATFEQIGQAEVVIVPGGLGCERAADDPELRAFLHRMEHSARYVAASSTGTVVLASAGLLHGASAATHWLAPPPVTPLSVMVELVDNDHLRRQIKRRSRHRSKR